MLCYKCTEILEYFLLKNDISLDKKLVDNNHIMCFKIMYYIDQITGSSFFLTWMFCDEQSTDGSVGNAQALSVLNWMFSI